jgi:hypothetical protein
LHVIQRFQRIEDLLHLQRLVAGEFGLGFRDAW